MFDASPTIERCNSSTIDEHDAAGKMFGPSRIDQKSPEHMLMFAILSDAVDIVQKHHKSGNFLHRKLFRQAVAWISLRDDYVFGFDGVCAALGFDADAVRDALAKRYWPKPAQKAVRLAVADALRRDPHLAHDFFHIGCPGCISTAKQVKKDRELRKAAINVYCRCGCRKRQHARGVCKLIYTAAFAACGGTPTDAELVAAIDRAIARRKLLAERAA